jgi:hypothetical protein
MPHRRLPSRQTCNGSFGLRLWASGKASSATHPQRASGRADDFAWPRREVEQERVKGETAMALASPNVGARVMAPAASPKPKKHRSWMWERSFARGNVW